MTGLGLLPIQPDPGAKCMPPEPFLNLPNDARRARANVGFLETRNC